MLVSPPLKKLFKSLLKILKLHLVFILRFTFLLVYVPLTLRGMNILLDVLNLLTFTQPVIPPVNLGNVTP